MATIVSEVEQQFREELSEELFNHIDPCGLQLMGTAFDWLRKKAKSNCLEVALFLGMEEVVCDNCPLLKKEPNT